MVHTPAEYLFAGRQKNSTKTFEIIPDNPFVVFSGRDADAPPVEVAGKLVLTNSDYINVRSIKIKFDGLRKVSWLTNAVNPHPIVQKKTFYHDENIMFPTDPTSSTVHKVGAGRHEWRFSFQLPQAMPESVEGLPGSYIVYDLTATVDRGYMTKDLNARKRIRVIRTLGSDSADNLTLEQINEDIWSNKISYKITVPKVNYIYGTSVTADFVLTPIKKGLTIGAISMELVEKVAVATEYGGGLGSTHTSDSVVCKRTANMPPNSGVELSDEEALGSLCDESYHFQMTLPFEKSLNKCRQSVDTDCIKIDHKLRIYVSLHNPEGHVSQLLVKNMMSLFISPNLPICEDRSVSLNRIQEVEANAMNETNLEAPPIYGRHQLDLLYDDIEASGFNTPSGFRSGVASGISTPFTAQSRNASSEDLASLDAVANGDHSSHSQGGGASASALHSRLATLQEYGSSHAARAAFRQSSYHSGINTPYNGNEGGQSGGGSSHDSNSNQPSRRGSGHGGYFASWQVNGGEGYDMEALARIPSYNTAVRTPAAVGTPGGEGLPTYEIAVSRRGSQEDQHLGEDQERVLLPFDQHQTQSNEASGHGTPISDGSITTVTDLRTALPVLPQLPIPAHQRRTPER
ncbi:hypothetical protein K402DRAFT_424955 [Aulographum hederae CBS 113979]|uniref:Arrestin C-terminal-like domain-containing protein n=1 Tax=Aulographum hederae CBS 113979 TaxID=1176131 RepID=A0A6G1GM19_9PEZI|nr:hypothetical protein K402DRAFT_424955 [Aulographum hederae CBS 113979]